MRALCTHLPLYSYTQVDNPKKQPTPAALVAPPSGQLKSVFEKIGKGAIAANAVLERVGKVTDPPPRPLTTKERVLQYHKLNDDSFDESLWQWRQGGWTHLPPPERREREEVRPWRTLNTNPQPSSSPLIPSLTQPSP